MSSRKLPFLFVSDTSALPSEHDFVIKIPKGVRSKADLLTYYEREGHFPTGFGFNWDALLDFLRDFSWVNQKRIVITHYDLPPLNDQNELRVYIEILETAVNDWKKVREGPFVEPPEEMPFIEHDLLVVFPLSVESSIARVL
jgi:Barstar (barnase inhibitor)